jgi:hypothetical protein
MARLDQTPKVTNPRTQRNLHRALQRAESENDKTRIDLIKNYLNGAQALPEPNVKKPKT